MSTTNNLIAPLVCTVLTWTSSACFGQGVFVDDFFDDTISGRFVIEAEHYNSRSKGLEADWWEVDGSSHRFVEGPLIGELAPTRRSGNRGNYMEVIGKQIGSIPPILPTYHGPLLTYKVWIDTPGKYRLYVRWKGRTNSTDSLYAYLVDPANNILVDAGPMWFLYHQFRSTWVWDVRGVKDTTVSASAGFPHTAIWDISKPGFHTIVIALREAETAIDALILQTDDLDSPIGEGPVESILVTETELLGLRITKAITAKQKEIEHLEKLTSEEQMIVTSMQEMFQSNASDDIDRRKLVAARNMVQSSIKQQEGSMRELEKSIAKLEKALRFLGWDN